MCKVFSYDLFVQSSAPKKFFMKIRYKTNKNNYESLRFRWVICLFYWKENLKKSTRLWNVNKLSFFFYALDIIKNILRSKNIPNDLVIYYFEVIIFCSWETFKKNNKTWIKVFYLYSGAPCVDCPRRGLTTSTAHFVPGIGHSCP